MEKRLWKICFFLRPAFHPLLCMCACVCQCVRGWTVKWGEMILALYWPVLVCYSTIFFALFGSFIKLVSFTKFFFTKIAIFKIFILVNKIVKVISLVKDLLFTSSSVKIDFWSAKIKFSRVSKGEEGVFVSLWNSKADRWNYTMKFNEI